MDQLEESDTEKEVDIHKAIQQNRLWSPECLAMITVSLDITDTTGQVWANILCQGTHTHRRSWGGSCYSIVIPLSMHLELCAVLENVNCEVSAASPIVVVPKTSWAKL